MSARTSHLSRLPAAREAQPKVSAAAQGGGGNTGRIFARIPHCKHSETRSAERAGVFVVARAQVSQSIRVAQREPPRRLNRSTGWEGGRRRAAPPVRGPDGGFS